MDINNVETQLDEVVTLLKAMSNKRRMMVLCALCKGEKSVGELEKIVGLSQSALSQHLARLRRDGYVETRREAQTIYYSTGSDKLCALLTTLNELYMQDVDCTKGHDEPDIHK